MPTESIKTRAPVPSSENPPVQSETTHGHYCVNNKGNNDLRHPVCTLVDPII